MQSANIRRHLFKSFRIVASRADKGAIERAIALLRPVKHDLRMIRIGPDKDGGYVLPDDLDGVSYCFSPGVSDSSDFELDLTNRFGIPSFLADASVAGPAVASPNFDFEPLFLGAYDDAPYSTLDTWMTAKLPNAAQDDLLLQMDIEGDEYTTLLAVSPQNLCRFRIMAIEFHQLQALADPFTGKMIESVLRKITKTHLPIALNPNNTVTPFQLDDIVIPPVLEVTFLRRDRFAVAAKRDGPPTSLGQLCDANRPPIMLSTHWTPHD